MKSIMFISLIALTMSTAQAAQKMKTVRAANSSNANSSSTTYSHHIDSEDGFKFEARPGLGTVNSTFAFGAGLEAKYGFNVGKGMDVFAGLETGFYHGGTDLAGKFATVQVNMIPILATSSFEFPVSNHVRLSANVGVGIAIVMAHYSLDMAHYGADAVAESIPTSTDFMWSVGPGMLLNDTFVASLPLGTIDGAFYFLPTIGARF